jgi:hypothetical protein
MEEIKIGRKFNEQSIRFNFLAIVLFFNPKFSFFAIDKISAVFLSASELNYYPSSFGLD